MPTKRESEEPDWYWFVMHGLDLLQAERDELLGALEPFAIFANGGAKTAEVAGFVDFADALRQAAAVYFRMKGGDD